MAPWKCVAEVFNFRALSGLDRLEVEDNGENIR